MSRTVRNEPRAKRTRTTAPVFRRHVPTRMTRAMLRALCAMNPTTESRSNAY